ncbi:GAF domain-containing sensor histidine kinase [Rhodohalobacter halophilus]|uniref:GAF domain-containing sensor histidine kinase n=1 Tax=Rhodohalobacter halophilus TaxID=1812810 RepID=UPI00083FC9F4|nr:GAF domain-containing sensor histidine kinase [Rhodohalobacter halophilus]
MAETPTPAIEKKRLQKLYSYDVLDTSPEKEFDDLTKLAAEICEAPIARVNLIDKDRQWSKSIFGIDESSREVPRDITVCQYTILKEQTLEIPNLAKDPRFKNFDYVQHEPHLRYYLGAPLLSPDGYAVGALCVLDYKERKMSDKQRGQLQILANEVVARLELRKQNEELKRLNDHKLKLMKMLSHDMRSPLNGIIGVGSLLSEIIEGDEEQEMLSLMEQSAIQLNQMIDEILSFSLIESEGFTLNRSEVNPVQMTDSMKRLYVPVSRSKGVDLKMEVESDRNVYIDKEKFEQVYGNLLSNAIKFTKPGGEVSSKISIDGNRLLLRVEDSGVGMDDVTVTQLFSNGESSHEVGTSGEKSTGLGLAIVKYFVDLHNGSIDVTSSKGEGTRFTISIPINEDE